MDDVWGGAIFCDNGASPMVVDCVLLNNTAMGWPSNGYGGGLYCSGGTWVIVGSTFCQNSAGNSGGGIACREGLLDVANTIVAFS